jgi:hypothetical protein
MKKFIIAFALVIGLLAGTALLTTVTGQPKAYACATAPC